MWVALEQYSITVPIHQCIITTFKQQLDNAVFTVNRGHLAGTSQHHVQGVVKHLELRGVGVIAHLPGVELGANHDIQRGVGRTGCGETGGDDGR